MEQHVGRTKASIRQRAKWSLLVIGLLTLLLSMTTAVNRAEASEVRWNGLPGDANIHYVGRWDTSSKDLYVSNWGGAYFKTRFVGTTVQIKLAAAVNIYAQIDNGDDVYFENASGTVNLTPQPLRYGVHSLRVAARSEWDRIQFAGLILDPHAVTLPARTSSKLIEFVGDSITSGQGSSKWALTDYAWQAGEMLGTEHTQISYAGIPLVDGVKWWHPNPVGMSKQYFKTGTVDHLDLPDWDFSRYTANAVVINLGVNDNNPDYHIDDEIFRTTYISFLERVRQKYPYAQIFAMRPFYGLKEVPMKAALQTRIDAGDTRLHYVDTTHWTDDPADFVDGIHPNDAGHIKFAKILADQIKPYLC